MVVDSISSGIAYVPFFFVPLKQGKDTLSSFFLFPSVLIRLDGSTVGRNEEGLTSLPLPLYSLTESKSYTETLEEVFQSVPCCYYPYPEQKEKREMFPSFQLRCVEEVISSELLIVDFLYLE